MIPRSTAPVVAATPKGGDGVVAPVLGAKREESEVLKKRTSEPAGGGLGWWINTVRRRMLTKKDWRHVHATSSLVRSKLYNNREGYIYMYGIVQPKRLWLTSSLDDAAMLPENTSRVLRRTAEMRIVFSDAPRFKCSTTSHHRFCDTPPPPPKKEKKKKTATFSITHDSWLFDTKKDAMK